MKTFSEMLEAKWAEGKYLCVGLDPILERLPEDLQGYANVRKTSQDIAGCLGEAMVRVIDATHGIAAAYKPNSAFYERYGAPGWSALKRVVKRAKDAGVPVILDAKRGDIGNTNEHYAAMAFDAIGADAITIHPYLGWEANQPFLSRADKGIFVLCRTSNPGAGEFQDMQVQGPEVYDGGIWATWHREYWNQYQQVAVHVSSPETWNQNGNCGLVTGATYPAEIACVRKIAPDIPLLIPGIGKQNGDLEASVEAARHRCLINVSSEIDFADDLYQAANNRHRQIQQALP